MPVAVPPTLLCIVRFRAVQRFAAQCSDVLQNATLCTDMLYSAELCTDVLNSAGLDRTVPICAAQCSIVKSCATQCCTHCYAVLHSTKVCMALWVPCVDCEGCG